MSDIIQAEAIDMDSFAVLSPQPPPDDLWSPKVVWTNSPNVQARRATIGLVGTTLASWSVTLTPNIGTLNVYSGVLSLFGHYAPIIYTPPYGYSGKVRMDVWCRGVITGSATVVCSAGAWDIVFELLGNISWGGGITGKRTTEHWIKVNGVLCPDPDINTTASTGPETVRGSHPQYPLTIEDKATMQGVDGSSIGANMGAHGHVSFMWKGTTDNVHNPCPTYLYPFILCNSKMQVDCEMVGMLPGANGDVFAAGDSRPFMGEKTVHTLSDNLTYGPYETGKQDASNALKNGEREAMIGDAIAYDFDATGSAKVVATPKGQGWATSKTTIVWNAYAW